MVLLAGIKYRCPEALCITFSFTGSKTTQPCNDLTKLSLSKVVLTMLKRGPAQLVSTRIELKTLILRILNENDLSFLIFKICWFNSKLFNF